jgi:hypothetical protein
MKRPVIGRFFISMTLKGLPNITGKTAYNPINGLTKNVPLRSVFLMWRGGRDSNIIPSMGARVCLTKYAHF